ncbi:hypothetical protein CHM34_01130 [Paludifilum halophilum]|uniref:Uncharacterized protein n=1 Tax=Paludifilum halophilum TaxID=1642702 RepID=A0A235BBH4_9BACL|nr:hypothetical protein CHM34_01130 [Paludifilum halophilum]
MDSEKNKYPFTGSLRTGAGSLILHSEVEWNLFFLIRVFGDGFFITVLFPGVEKHQSKIYN